MAKTITYTLSHLRSTPSPKGGIFVNGAEDMSNTDENNFQDNI
jgi:hypothetical protein